LKAVAGDSQHCRAVELEIVPDAIREFISAHRIGTKSRVAAGR
jgi:hypothetical protein